MLRLLIISMVVVLSTLPAKTVSGQASFHRDYLSSGDNNSESKRLYKEGVKYALAGLYTQAAQIFQQALKLDPQFADAHFALGHAYFDLHRYQNAIESFKRAVELNPADLEAQNYLEQARDMLARENGKKGVVTPASEPVSKPAKEQVGGASPDLKAESKTGISGSKEPDPAAAAEFAMTKLYRVGPGDVLDVRINDSASPQSTLFTVTPAGLLEHPVLAEPMCVGGLSVEEIVTAFEGDLKRRALSDSPKVSVAVRDYASHTILVSGLVKDSGTKILRREAIPLYVVVADAQPMPEAARVTVVRSESNQTYDIDLNQAGEMNLLVRPGDVITLLANATQFLYVGGEVKLPGEKTFRRGLTLTQAIIAAGGPTDKAKEARLGRDDGRGFLTVTRLKLKEIESGKVPDPMVRPGDRIMIVK